MRRESISFAAAQRDYDEAEDASLDDSEPEPTADEYWNGLDERDDDDA